ncbi:unnamed protein product [Pseudo-nitzschia multistriata]|uniref:USP domain-containing protein n=1 Tax=Pseudo-nitzschia multistriata TaxID=183589 RepID=A0A448ZTH2_9STRA|nr:unnamed protein product [Pseudo-nitzschia multistriata]
MHHFGAAQIQRKQTRRSIAIRNTEYAIRNTQFRSAQDDRTKLAKPRKARQINRAMARGGSKPFPKRTGESLTLGFESVLVGDSGRSPKEFLGVAVEVVPGGKELYIGSNYKVKWKHAVDLKLLGRNDGADVQDGASDSDGEGEEGFELTCGPSSGSGESRRVFLVRGPLRSAVSWAAFSAALGGRFRRETRRRRRRQDKIEAEAEEERLREEEDRRQRLARGRSYRSGRSSRSYSKRPYDFMRKNAANIARNAEAWSDDEEEETYGRQEEEPEVEPQEPQDQEQEIPRDAAPHGGPDDGNESGEEEEEHEFGGETCEDAGTSDNPEGTEADRSETPRSPPSIEKEVKDDGDEEEAGQGDDDDDDDDEDEEEQVAPPPSRGSRTTGSASHPSRSTKQPRRRRRGPVLDDSSDEEGGNGQGESESDGEASATATTTTTSAAVQRVVTPPVGNATGSKKKAKPNPASLEAFFRPRARTSKVTQAKARTNADASETEAETGTAKSETAVSKPTGGGPSSSFFAPRGNLQKPLAPSTPPRSPGNKTPVRSEKQRNKTPRPGLLERAEASGGSPPGDEAMVSSAKKTAAAKDQTPLRFPVLASLQSGTRSDPDRSSHSGVARAETEAEAEDPIEDFGPSSQSPRSKRPLFSPSGSRGSTALRIKRRRLRLRGASKSALEALDFADAKTVRSPLQPQRLGQRVEEAAGSSGGHSLWRGLRNDGNSCYVNASLQQLFSVPAFMEALAARTRGKGGSSGDGLTLTTALVDLYRDLFGGSPRTDSPAPLASASAGRVKAAVDRLTDRFRGCQQRDAHEFLGELIDRVHDELVGAAGGEEGENQPIEPTDEFFRWNVKVCLECKHCGYSRSKEEMHRYLSIDIDHGSADSGPAVGACLARFFSPEDREIDCEKCKIGKTATQTMEVLSPPRVVLLHLKRFLVEERAKGGSGPPGLVFRKNRAPVELAEALDIEAVRGDLTKSDRDNDNDKPSDGPATTQRHRYSLRSVVHHIGSTSVSGHYTADALRKDPLSGEDRWVSYDDGATAETKQGVVVGSSSNQKTAYMLLYASAPSGAAGP